MFSSHNKSSLVKTKKVLHNNDKDDDADANDDADVHPLGDWHSHNLWQQGLQYQAVGHLLWGPSADTAPGTADH